ncbi:MAG: DNA replication/repair protein RecF [Candidatus Dadabacteria bacterium]|nr:DNA replication/repair protein RecF [Candidatus Dadabacteria bacterium]NIS08611.1 DNA replication/repair protein RecF [Candidatus Dadabacteria bacterium]NIV42394.1 DNA replication and repair protein RecF [Candidatus Dadabacteria bacterium]NIY22316.1 DNA replication and repair protein RecF [Candidatus Dadabacteria bacterium]
MPVKSLTLLNYRNYNNQSFTFDDKFNLIIGKNGHGKTNLLEAINLVCKFKPFKKTNFDELINFDTNETRLKAELLNNKNLNEINIQLLKGKKIIKLNNKILYKTAKYSSMNKLVTFLPSEIELIKGQASVRRNYIDQMITGVDPEHLADSKNYYKILRQRNALLAKSQKDSLAMIEIWDEKLSEPAERIVFRRMKFIRKITPVINKYYERISAANSQIDIKYKSTFDITPRYKEEFRADLQKRMSRDILRKFTTSGPHRDQIIFSINGEDSSKFASQGESKTLVLSIKSAEIELYEQKSGEHPILILDDISSELDDTRKNYFSDLLNNYSGQIFVTTANLEPVFKRNADRIFHIESGRILNVE